MGFHPDTLPSLKGKVYIVTGGNSGIGLHTVAHLASKGAHVYLCARSPSKGEAAIADIKQSHPSARISLLTMDNNNMATVVAAAKRFLSLETSLHGLVNNAGIMATPFELTTDGHDIQWQTNYLAHWVFTSHLLPLMLQTSQKLPPGSVRLVNVSSSGHLAAPKEGINFADTKLADAGPWARYGQSKTANILHTLNLHMMYGPGSVSAREGKGEIWVSSVHPGLVQTNLGSGLRETASLSMRVFDVLKWVGMFTTADKGSWTSLYCIAGEGMQAAESGGYREIHGRFGEPKRLSEPAKDEALAKKLEKYTEEGMRKEGWLA